MLHFLNTNSGSIIAILTFVLAVSTGIYAYLTWRMVNETKRMREIQSEPNISIYFKSKEEYIGLIDLVIKNIGLGPAFNIDFKVNPDFKYTDNKNISELNLFKNGLNHLAPNQEIIFFLNSLPIILEQKLPLSFDITVNYENVMKKKFQNTYNIDLLEIMGLRRAGEPPLKKISDQLEKINNEIKKMFNFFPQLKVITYSKKEIDEENERIKKLIEEEEKKKQSDK
jgi:hypothetical protein